MLEKTDLEGDEGGMTISIATADDMDLVLEGIKAILRQQEDFEVIGTYQGLSDLVDALTEARPQVIVLGDRLDPALDVLALVESVRRITPRSRIIVMSSLPDGRIVHELFVAGAAGYMYKSDPLSLYLVDAVRTVVRGKPYLSPTANAEYLLAMQAEHPRWLFDAEARDVLHLMANGYRAQEIAALRGMPIRRVYWVANKLRDRFGADTNAQLMVRAAEEGFLP
jgi:DNA-binding NarL/FixJ family response regulator